MASDSPLTGADVPTLAKAAERYLASQSWCARVLQITPVFAVVGIVGVFRCSLLPSSLDADVIGLGSRR
jgi:hypothetical protein